VDGYESLSAIDGLIPDLQLQPFDYLFELVAFGLVAGIDAEQELPIVRVEDGLSAQGGRMRPDRSIMLLQIPSELTDIRLVELPELHPSYVSLLFMILAGPRPELIRSSPEMPSPGYAVLNPSTGCTESRLCFRVAQATYADTAKDATAMTTLQIAITVFAST
jgi:hypothetical protein